MCCLIIATAFSALSNSYEAAREMFAARRKRPG